MLVVSRGLLSRLLYPNPLCLLTSAHEGKMNVMTITWLTCVSNRGVFLASMNEGRHSASLVLAARRFVLSVPVHGQEPLVLAVGSWSGRDVDKFDALPNLRRTSVQPIAEDVYGVEGACAHMVCSVLETASTDGHHVLTCRIEGALVHPAYWRDGKTFRAADGVPGYLTFLGSKRFVEVGGGGGACYDGMDGPVMEGKRVRCVPYRKEHVQTYHEWMQRADLLEMTASERLTLEQEYDMCKSWERDPRKVTFILLDVSLEGHPMCGDVNVYLHRYFADGEAEIECMVAEERSQRKGIATEALQLMMQHARTFYRVHMFIAKIKSHNAPSLALFSKLGFERVADESDCFGEVELHLQVAPAKKYTDPLVKNNKKKKKKEKPVSREKLAAEIAKLEALVGTAKNDKARIRLAKLIERKKQTTMMME